MTETLHSETFGRYRLIACIATGGMAELFLAVYAGVEGFSKVVALKRVHPHLARSTANVDMFLDEARLAAKLDHPNIVRVYELGEVDGSYFISMEYLPGEDLAQIITRSRRLGRAIPIEIATAIVREAATGLHFAHEFSSNQGVGLGLVHRDINPSNILLTYHSATKVVDFGLAKTRITSHTTRAGVLKGKLNYFAPEQLHGKRLDRRTDIFGLGLVLYELLSGRPAFTGDTEAEILASVARAQIPSIGDHRNDVPHELEQILRRSLAPAVEDRYASAFELASALDTFAKTQNAQHSGHMLGNWLAELFGDERAQLKLAIAQGRELARNAPRLLHLGQSATPHHHHHPSSPAYFATDLEGRSVHTRPVITRPDIILARRRPRTSGVVVAGGLTLAAALSFFAVQLATDEGPANVDGKTASVSVTSEPLGAAIFIGGQPTGQITPETLEGLSTQQPVTLRLEKRGYAPLTAELALKPGTAIQASYVLTPTSAFLRFTNVAPNTAIIIDGTRVSELEEIEVSPGEHRIRIERGHTIVTERTVRVSAGDEHAIAAR